MQPNYMGFTIYRYIGLIFSKGKVEFLPEYTIDTTLGMVPLLSIMSWGTIKGVLCKVWWTYIIFLKYKSEKI